MTVDYSQYAFFNYKDRIKTVSHNTTSDTNCDVTYTFNYDSLGRKTSVKVGSQTLSTNVYENDRSGMLKEVQYGNGGKVGDEYDRLTDAKYPDKTIPRNSRTNNPDVYNIIEVDIE